MMAMREPIFSASSRSWLTKMMVRFSLLWTSRSSSWSRTRIERIERREGLVHQEDRRLGGKGAGEADALLHAAGELVHALLAPAVRPTRSSCFVTRSVRLARGTPSSSSPRATLSIDRAPGQQRELLEHHGHPPMRMLPQYVRAEQPRPRPSCRRRSTCTLPRDRPVQAVHGAHQRRLAGPGEPHEDGDLALAHRSSDASATPRSAPHRPRISFRGSCPGRSAPERFRRIAAEDDVDVLEGDGRRRSCRSVHFARPARRRCGSAVEHDRDERRWRGRPRCPSGC